jgi:hypothetical protein
MIIIDIIEVDGWQVIPFEHSLFLPLLKEAKRVTITVIDHLLGSNVLAEVELDHVVGVLFEKILLGLVTYNIIRRGNDIFETGYPGFVITKATEGGDEGHRNNSILKLNESGSYVMLRRDQAKIQFKGRPFVVENHPIFKFYIY